MVMKYLRKIQLSLILILAFSGFGYGQYCNDFHRIGDCRIDLDPSYRYYSQSRSDLIGVGYTIKYNIVFYGAKQYIISFCTKKKYYPVHFKLIDVITEEVIYDNNEDDYLESIGFAFENTKQILIEIEILAHKASNKEIEEYYPCLGMLIQFKSIKD